MNLNKVLTGGWSNQASETLYRTNWPDDPDVRDVHEAGSQCGGCSFYAKFNYDWGMCCNAASPHQLETVFEHFTCRQTIQEGWGPHSFNEDQRFHCRCGGIEGYLERGGTL